MTTTHQGLADGFIEYLSPRNEDLERVLTHGLVVVDTNVLLNLYRYHTGTREDLLSILDALGDRLFIPHQVAREFWRRRENAIREGVQASGVLTTDLEKYAKQSTEALSHWGNRTGLPERQIDQLHSVIRKAYAAVSARVDEFSADSVSLAAIDTNDDPVLPGLVKTVSGRVGTPFTESEYDLHVAEAKRRIEANEPPGFKDRGKEPDEACGDYLIWRQLLDEATDRRSDVLLVTGDLKEDWWLREKGDWRGPRLELSRELFAANGKRLYTIRPSSLLRSATRALDLTIRKASVEAAERVDRYSYNRQRRTFYTSGDVYPLVKLPTEGRSSYFETLMDMAMLALDEPNYDDFIEAFQRAFPTITRVEEARRRASILEKLGLVTVIDNQVRLTEHGERLLDEQSVALLQDQFMHRVGGAVEIRDLASVTPLPELRRQIRDSPPAALSPTQAALVLRWMEQLEIL